MQNGWISSDILGANSYKLLIDIDKRMSILAQERESNPYNDTIGFIPVKGNRDVRTLSMVSAPTSIRNRWTELIHIIEQSQEHFLFDSRYMWPIDCVSGDCGNGFIVRDYSETQYGPISDYFVKPMAKRWDIALKLLKAVDRIHAAGFALNGITREQVRVNKRSGEVLIYPGFYLSWPNICRYDSLRSGYFLIPEIIRSKESGEGIFTARKHDVFSVVTMAFYLLFYTHPFIGGKFWAYPHDQYYQQYSNFPEFIFAKGSGNHLQNLEFDNIIVDQWERTHSCLKGLFMDLYEEVCSIGKTRTHLDVWNLLLWIEAFGSDALINDNPRSRPDFPFETVVNYKV